MRFHISLAIFGTVLLGSTAPIPAGTTIVRHVSPASSAEVSGELQSAKKRVDVVYFNTKSLKYHCPRCEWAIKCTRNCIEITREQAKQRGGVACKICGGSCYSRTRLKLLPEGNGESGFVVRRNVVRRFL